MNLVRSKYFIYNLTNYNWLEIQLERASGIESPLFGAK